MGRSTHKTQLTQAREDSLLELVARLDLPLEGVDLLNVAFTHTSYANEHKKLGLHHNQRLEFLGDAVLDLIIGEYLFHNYHDMAEGDLTKIKAATVCEPSLASVSRQLDLGRYLLMGHGETMCGGQYRESILADTFECLVGTLYLAASYEEAKKFVLHYLMDNLKQALLGKRGNDYKTMLQEFVQEDGDCHIEYNLVSESGPDHAKTFTMEVVIEGKVYAKGTGKSKKIAEQAAAKATFEILQSEV